MAQEAAEVIVRVQDTGIGIAPDMLAMIFDLFVQAERRLNRSQGGVGIGLTLVRRLVEMHGGTVAAYSEGLGKGSEFVVRLPALPNDRQGGVPAPAQERQVASPAIHRRILVVDDNVDAVESLALLLRLDGHEVQAVYDGPSALAAAATNPPEVAILDLGMPGMDGYELARRLRKLPETKDVLLLALTGWAEANDRQRCFEAGFDGHLPKPVDWEALRQFLAHPRLFKRSSVGS